MNFRGNNLRMIIVIHLIKQTGKLNIKNLFILRTYLHTNRETIKGPLGVGDEDDIIVCGSISNWSI